ncbi:MAG: hypothetical protein ABJF10_04900 [Chthoniobacter sp.]|uniref:hypothetical protein n=1 Tax=Chthoniobacter sp. TaxID=2510640 RepID=UPI0032A246D9
MFPRSPRSAIACLTVGLFASATLHADQDAPPVDVNALLKQLHTLRDQQAVQAKTSRQAAIQLINAAAGSTERSVKLWEDAVQATQMEGAGKEAAQFRAWRDTEGELFKEKEVQNAVHLHLEWLSLTLQRSNGVAVKDLLPAIVNYTKELLADQAWMEALDDTIKKEKDAAAGPGPKKQGRQAAKDDVAIRKTHDGILNRKLDNSIIVQWLKLSDFVTLEKWEGNPGNLDGIYKNTVLPEMRLQKDPHVFDYWDMKLKKEADAATKSKLSFEVDKYNTQRRPTLLWNRAQEYTYLGQKNRAVSEMFNLIKTYSTHPDASDWVAALEAMLAPAGPAPDANAPVPAAPATSALPPVAPPPPAATAQPFVPSNGPTPTALLPGAQ